MFRKCFNYHPRVAEKVTKLKYTAKQTLMKEKLHFGQKVTLLIKLSEFERHKNSLPADMIKYPTRFVHFLSFMI